jgi:hypothetical protein
MAEGDISAAIDSLVYKGPNVVIGPKVAHAIGDFYVFAYAKPDSTGHIDTLEIDSAGNIAAAVTDTLQFDATQGFEPAIIKVGTGVVAVVYRGPDNDGFIKTIAIASDGSITGVVETVEFDTTECYEPEIINRSGTMYAIVYEQSTVRQGLVATIGISAAGDIDAAVTDTLVFDATQGFEPDIIHLLGDVCVIGASGPGTDGWLYTVDITSAGAIGSVLDTQEFDTVRATGTHLAKVADDMIAIVYTDTSDDGWLRTWGIASNGTIDAAESDSEEFAPSRGVDPYILETYTNFFAIAWSDPDEDMQVATYPIADNGTIGAQIDQQEFGVVTTKNAQLLHITGTQVYILSTEEGTRNGVATTLTIETTLPSTGLVLTVCGLDVLAYILGIHTERGRDDELADTGTGSALLTMDNNSGDFSPENTGGAFYPTLDLGCAVVIQENVQGTDYDVFRGKVDKIIPKDSPDVTGRTADLAVLDGMDDLAQREISIAKLTGTTADALIDDALDEAGWGAGDRNLDSGVDTFEQGWAHRESALAFILDVAKQEGGFFYVDTDGKATYENRHHRIQGAHLTSRHDFSTAIGDVQYEFSKRFLFNKSRITGKAYIVDPDDAFLWSAKTGNNQEAPFVGPGDTVTIIAELPLALDSFTALGAGGTYWNANSAADKSGTDVTSDFSIVVTQKGQQLEIAITNAGSVGGYMVAPDTLPGSPVPDDLTGQTLLIVGKLLQEYDLAFVVEDATSKSTYGARSWDFDSRFNSRPQQLIAYANHIVTRFKDPVPTPVSFTIQVEVDDTNRQWAVDLKLSDRCTVASTRLGFDQDYYVNKIEHDYVIRGSKYSHSVTFHLERTAGAAEGIAWLLGEVGFGELGTNTYLVW